MEKIDIEGIKTLDELVESDPKIREIFRQVVYGLALSRDSEARADAIQALKKKVPSFRGVCRGDDELLLEIKVGEKIQTVSLGKIPTEYEGLPVTHVYAFRFD